MWLVDELIGRVDFGPVAPPHYSIEYWIDAAQTGRGYVTIACRAVLRHAADVLNATAVFGGVTHGNAKSVAVLERLGFARVAESDSYTRFRVDFFPNPSLRSPATAREDQSTSNLE
jgi:RimJ/RimL family protein N-acetyltransferase